MTKLKLQNTVDFGNASRGLIAFDEVRVLEIEALVDTGATMLAIPVEAAAALGLPEKERKKVKLADGSVLELARVTELTIEILGRSMACDALVLPTGATALIGQIPLEGLDLVVDPKSREVRVNPASPDTPMMDLLRAS
ncbi:MAG TPA: clan AA aspartic protease [Polyangiaceae bacterium]